MKIRTQTIILLFTLGLFACGEKYSTEIKKDIIGVWESNDKSLTLEFTDQGKVNSNRNTDEFTNESTSNLIFIDDNHILGVWEFNLAIWEVKVSSDKMILIRDDGEKLKFNKIS